MNISVFDVPPGPPYVPVVLSIYPLLPISLAFVMLDIYGDHLFMATEKEDETIVGFFLICIP